MNIVEVIKHIASQVVGVKLMQGVVKAVQEDTCTVAIDYGTDEELALEKVKLNVVEGSKKSTYAKPAVGAYALIIKLPEVDNWYLLHASTTEMQHLNGKDFGGLVKVKELTDKLNAIEKLLNNFLNDFKNHTHSINTPFVGTINPGTPASMPITGTVTMGDTMKTVCVLNAVNETKVKDIENPNVNHG